MPDVLDRTERHVAGRAASLDADAREVEIVAATDFAVRRRDLDGAFNEVLDLAPGAIRLDRFNRGAALLDTHDQWGLASKLGAVVPGSARIEGGQLRCRIRLSRNAAGEALLADLSDGITASFSVGYRVHGSTRDESTEPPTVTATDWEPFEVSAVPVPADPNAVARSAADSTPTDQQGGDAPRRFPRSIMPDVLSRFRRTTTPPPTESAEPALETRMGDLAGRAAQIIRPERMTMRERRDLAARHMEADRAAAFVVESEELDDAAFRTALLDKMADESEAAPIMPYGDPGRAARRSDVRAMAAALAHRFGARGELPEEARQYRGMSMADAAGLILEREGKSRGLRTASELIKRAHTTSDFPKLLGSMVGRMMRPAYEEAAGALKQVAREASATDFRSKHSIAFDRADFSFTKVPEAGEYQYGTVEESKESYRLETFGKIMSLTRQALVNDDLAGFTRMAEMHGRAAAALESETLAGLVEQNPTLAATKRPVFHADHGNLDGAGTPLSVASLSAARLAMRRQTGLGSNRIAVRPRFLIVPPELETTAEQIMAAIDAGTTDAVNPFGGGALDLIVEPYFTDPAAWYIAADPGSIDGIEYAYLAGEEGLQVMTEQGFDSDVFKVKGRLDYGAGWIDYRGWYKNPGA